MNECKKDKKFILEYYFFDYVYTSLHVIFHHKELLSNVLNISDLFLKYDDDEISKEDRLITCNILHAVLLRENGYESSFNVDLLTSEEYHLALYLIIFLEKFKYYPWDINRCPIPEDILDIILADNLLRPQKIFNPSEEYRHVLSVMLSLDSSKLVDSEKFHNSIIDMLNEEKSKSKTKINKDVSSCLKKRKNELLLKIYKDEDLTKKSESFSREFKKTYKQPYSHDRSLIPRIIGLALFYEHCKIIEKNNLKNLDTPNFQDVFRNFQNSTFYEKIYSSKYSNLVEVEERSFRRYLEFTIKSIKECKYIEIS